MDSQQEDCWKGQSHEDSFVMILKEGPFASLGEEKDRTYSEFSNGMQRR